MLSNRYFKRCFGRTSYPRRGGLPNSPFSIFEFLFSATSNRQFAQLEITFNCHKTKAAHVF